MLDREPTAAEVRSLLERARGAWADVHVADDRFLAYLAERVDGTVDLAALRVVDLYLACACADGDARAHAAFERAHLGQVPRFIARVSSEPALAEEVTQRLREKLFLPGPGGRPYIAEYSGRGDLRAWLRVIAVRLALRLCRRAAATRQQPLEPDCWLAGANPELDYLRLRHRADVESAFHRVVAQLEPRAVLLLKLHYLDGLSLEAIADLYHVHRATAARWLAGSRQLLLDGTRRALRERLRLSEDELDSLLGFVRSRLEVTLRDALGAEAE
ncbi:MAG TPA: hypothetical protein VKE22_00315 [Haliangiales bacterium]|nr:hypothetical protein [Haliangiales bacterium]